MHLLRRLFHRRPKIATVTHMGVLRIEPGDTLVVTLPEHTFSKSSVSSRKHIVAGIKNATGAANIILLPGPATVGAIRRTTTPTNPA